MTDSLRNILEGVQSDLHDTGVSDALVREILSYRLLIERLGESDNNGWWDSQVLSDLGRDRLEEVTPKTAMKARLDLAQKIGKKVEQSATNPDSISLFYLGPKIEAQISSELESLTIKSTFEELESMSNTFTTTGWTDGLIDSIKFEERAATGAVRLDTSPPDESTLKSRSEVRRIAKECFVAYGQSTEGDLTVPYYDVEL